MDGAAEFLFVLALPACEEFPHGRPWVDLSDSVFLSGTGDGLVSVVAPCQSENFGEAEAE